MQVELALQIVQLLGVRLFKADPDEMPGLAAQAAPSSRVILVTFLPAL
jgi:hypothetical protein